MPKPGRAQGYENTPKEAKGAVAPVINTDAGGEPRVTFMPVRRQDNPFLRKCFCDNILIFVIVFVESIKTEHPKQA